MEIKKSGKFADRRFEFVCQHCDCEFEAHYSELSRHIHVQGEEEVVTLYCGCPECGQSVALSEQKDG